MIDYSRATPKRDRVSIKFAPHRSVYTGRLIAMNVLEEYSLREVARLLPCPLRTVEREIPDALAVLSRALLGSGLIKRA